MATKNATSRTVTASGRLFEGGQDRMIITEGKTQLTLADIVNNELYPFEKKNVKVKLTIEIEEIE